MDTLDAALKAADYVTRVGEAMKGRQGAASARDAALRLGVSLRAAQGALKELSSSGACQLRRDGRTVEYVVEDTVFSEPTQRLAAERLRGLAASPRA